MRILKVTQSYYPFLDRGGPTVKVRALARGMAAAGHQVTVLSADQGFDPATRGRTHGHVPAHRSKHLDETHLPHVSWRSDGSRREPLDCDRGTGTPRVDERWHSGPADCGSSERN